MTATFCAAITTLMLCLLPYCVLGDQSSRKTIGIGTIIVSVLFAVLGGSLLLMAIYFCCKPRTRSSKDVLLKDLEGVWYLHPRRIPIGSEWGQGKQRRDLHREGRTTNGTLKKALTTPLFNFCENYLQRHSKSIQNHHAASCESLLLPPPQHLQHLALKIKILFSPNSKSCDNRPFNS